MAVIDKSYLIGEGDKFKQSTNTTLRQNGFSLEYYEVFYSLEAAKEYSKLNPLAYVGQKISVVDEISKTAVIYLILNEDGDLREIGTKVDNLGPEVISSVDKILEVTNEGKLLATLGLKWEGQTLSIIGKNDEVLDTVDIKTIPTKGEYIEKDETLVLTWEVLNEAGETEEKEVKIPFTAVLTEWEPENTDSIELERSRVVEGKDILKAIVNLYIPPEESDQLGNAIEIIKSGGLYVPDLSEGASEEFNNLKKVEDSIKSIKSDWTIKSSSDTSTIALTVTEEGILSGDVISDDKTIVSGENGVEVNIDGVSLVYNNDINKLTVGRIDCGTFE
jgi:hypothetical protein